MLAIKLAYDKQPISVTNSTLSPVLKACHGVAILKNINGTKFAVSIAGAKNLS